MTVKNWKVYYDIVYPGVIYKICYVPFINAKTHEEAVNLVNKNLCKK